MAYLAEAALAEHFDEGEPVQADLLAVAAAFDERLDRFAGAVLSAAAVLGAAGAVLSAGTVLSAAAAAGVAGAVLGAGARSLGLLGRTRLGLLGRGGLGRLSDRGDDRTH